MAELALSLTEKGRELAATFPYCISSRNNPRGQRNNPRGQLWKRHTNSSVVAELSC